MDVLETAHKLDTVSLVKMMRRDRGGMVQTGEQYEFLYESLRAFATERNVALGVDALLTPALRGRPTVHIEPYINVDVGGVFGTDAGLRGDSRTDDPTSVNQTAARKRLATPSAAEQSRTSGFGNAKRGVGGEVATNRELAERNITKHARANKTEL
jgi:hypothetical protein